MAAVIVAAVARNGVIGVDGDLPWRIPEDLARFKQLTMGGCLVMGRRTYESIGRPLPGRHTVVLTRDPGWSSPGVDTAADVDVALGIARDRDQTAFVVGGSSVYEAALGIADRLELTEVDQEPEGDTVFPDVDWDEWQEVSREDKPGYSFVTYVRADVAPTSSRSKTG